MEAVHREALCFGGIEKTHDTLIAVFRQLCIIHGRGQISQSRFRQQDGLAGKIGISADNAADFRPGNQKEVDVPGVCRVRGIAMPIVPSFFSQIEAAFRRVVVEISDGSSAFSGEADIKGDVLIERGCFFRIIAEGISGGHTQKALCLVQMPGHFPEAVKVILILYAHGVNPPVVAVFPVTELRDILVDQLSVPVEDRDKKRVFMDHNAQTATL